MNLGRRHKQIKLKKNRKMFKYHITKYINQINDYENAIIDTNIEHIYDMIMNLYNGTGWLPNTLQGYIYCANHENSMRKEPIWNIPNESQFKSLLKIRIL